MPFVLCPECGTPNSDLSMACPRCGFPIGYVTERGRDHCWSLGEA